MGPSSKDLLPLEKHDSSNLSLGSSLLICKNKASVSRNKPSHPDTKSFPSMPVHASQVLGRVKDFLGVISEANRRLEIDAKENPGNFDIEALDGNESQIIEMDLMLGIADLHTAEAIAAAESSIAGDQPAESLSASSNETDSEDSSDDDDSDGGGNHGGENGRFIEELQKPKYQGDASAETTGKNRSKKLSKRPKIVELP
ncbi:hypothetical protein MLD38_038068 [Melastoma candidum]|uniref:Uncharacterized protein n=1 Tax=Melastoma candidum TaxID=119954 RepID=A0ACB9KXV3_9MYRT|nr:hypothetical protein MLD38_038068 [Melastoma candidum]